MQGMSPIAAGLILSSCSFALVGCGVKVRHASSPAVQRPAPTPPDSSGSYRLGLGDVLEIKFFNNREFNETVPVRPDGRISIEKAGEIAVEGRTPSYVDSVITAVYAGFVRNPEVTVIVRAFGSSQVYVLGEVNSPGRFPLQPKLTVLQAVACAGGPKDTAQLNSVLLIRRGNRGEPIATRVDLSTTGDRAIGNSDFAMRPLDLIYVPRTFVADAASFMAKLYEAFLPPVDAYLRALFYAR